MICVEEIWRTIVLSELTMRETFVLICAVLGFIVFNANLFLCF